MSHLDLICDHSKEKLVVVPQDVLDLTNLKMLFLEGNFITALPENLFRKLPKLMWLDLRNNLLESIPASIAFHEKLENLLLSNNNLHNLPNELGTIPNLKALQVSDNPLVYPSRPVIVSGTKTIINFLKAQYESDRVKKQREDDDTDKTTATDSSIINEEEFRRDEQLVKVTEIGSYKSYNNMETSAKPSKETNRPSSKNSVVRTIRKKVSDGQTLNPDLKIKQLLSPEIVRCKRDTDKTKIVHKVSRTGSKLFLKSYFNKPLCGGDGKKFNNLKEGWLNELRILLTDQERILQQENEDHPKPPYDTDERYSKMPSREDLAKQFSEFTEKGYVSREPTTYSTINVQKMINGLMEQLKDMQIAYDPLSPGAEAEKAEMQIRTIMEIQKKLMNLKSINEKTL
uniref:Leucine-rich repeat protein soc-2 homolog n=1 Tax=Diabrotica virgifera virgifera TaxID=50390 RepID=A0A6P7FP60_DIAVI